MQKKFYLYPLTKVYIAIGIAIINLLLVIGSYTFIGISWTEVFYLTTPPSPVLCYVGPNLATPFYFLAIVVGLFLIRKIFERAVIATEEIPVAGFRETATKKINFIYGSLVPILVGIVFSGGHVLYNLSMTGVTATCFVFYNIYSIFPDFILGYLFWFCVGSVYFIAYLGNIYVSEKKLLTSDLAFGFGPLIRFGLTSASSWGVLGAILLPMMIYYPEDPISRLLVFSGIISYCISVLLFYFLPLLGVNRKLTKLKNEKTIAVSEALYEKINAVMSDLKARLEIPSTYFLELLGLEAVSNRTEQINVWGINSEIARKLGGGAILPILTFILKYFVQLFFPGVPLP